MQKGKVFSSRKDGRESLAQKLEDSVSPEKKVEVLKTGLGEGKRRSRENSVQGMKIEHKQN